MKKINLLELKLVNFKGIRNQSIPFTENTEISGANGTGKTTINDGFLWLLFGKNSEDKTDFNVKTLDEHNQVIPKIDHEVIGTFEVDGEQVVFRRVLKENWVTKRGNDFEEFKGNTTTYFVDDVPKSQAEFKSSVSSIIDEKISKLICSPTFFNSNVSNWGWKDRREILDVMAGDISDEEILGSGTDYSSVLEFLTANKDLEDEKKRVTAERLKAKKEQDGIQPRIDEVQRNKPEASNWVEIEGEIKHYKKEINSIDEQIEDKNKSVKSERERVGEIETNKYNKEQELVGLKRANDATKGVVNPEFTKQLGIKNNELKLINTSISNNVEEIEELTTSSSTLKETNADLIKEWTELNKGTFEFDSTSTDCPACKRPLDDAKIKQEELRSNFNTNKVNRLAEITKTGKENEIKINENDKRVKELEENMSNLDTKKPPINTEIEELNDKINTSSVDPKPTEAMVLLKKEIEAIVVPKIVVPDVAELKTKKEEFDGFIENCETMLTDRDKIKEIDERVVELNDQRRVLSQTIADCQKVEMQIDKFNKSKASLIEERVNSKFSIVKFKMFEPQINGGETPTCICTSNGVPFSDMNTALQINAGLDIINTMQKHFEVLAPVFVDHKESVTELIDMDCQIISLKVDDTVDGLHVMNG